jgi:hypothetical protein
MMMMMMMIIIIIESVCVYWDSISNINRLENTTENFGASFQKNRFCVDKVPDGFCLKDCVIKTNPHTLEELRDSSRYKISTISGGKRQDVRNAFSRYIKCIRSGGQYFQHVL